MLNNTLNNSKSKSQYSFPKEKRFNEKQTYLCDRFYDLPDLKSKRQAGIGYSHKYDFTKGKQKTPDPTKYLIKSRIDILTEKKIGVLMGESRTVPLYNSRKWRSTGYSITLLNSCQGPASTTRSRAWREWSTPSGRGRRTRMPIRVRTWPRALDSTSRTTRLMSSADMCFPNCRIRRRATSTPRIPNAFP